MLQILASIDDCAFGNFKRQVGYLVFKPTMDKKQARSREE